MAQFRELYLSLDRPVPVKWSWVQVLILILLTRVCIGSNSETLFMCASTYFIYIWYRSLISEIIFVIVLYYLYHIHNLCTVYVYGYFYSWVSLVISLGRCDKVKWRYWWKTLTTWQSLKIFCEVFSCLCIFILLWWFLCWRLIGK